MHLRADCTKAFAVVAISMKQSSASNAQLSVQLLEQE